MVDKEEIRKLLKQYFMTKASVFIRDNGTVYIGGAIDLKISKKVNQLPVKFDKIAGCFDCVNNRLTSLENSPEEVGGAFDCSGNRLTSLIGAPKRIEGDFTCWDNPLTSLAGIPEYVGNRIWISYSKNLPLLRLISVKCSGFVFDPPEKYSYSKKIESVMNQFKGQGKRGFLAATSALLKLEKELQKEDPSISIRENIKW